MAQALSWTIINLLLRWGIAVVFLVAGTLKAADPEAFLQDIQAYRLVPYGMAFVTAFFLPWLEIFAALCLVLKRAYTGAVIMLIGTILVFTLALVFAWVRGLDINCGCFGHNAHNATAYPLALLRNAGIFLGLIALIWQEQRKTTIAAMLRRSQDKAGVCR